MNKDKKTEIVAYLFWGGLTTVVSWGSYSILSFLFKPFSSTLFVYGHSISTTVLFSNTLSWVCAVSFAFVTNKMWVFHSNSWKKNIVLPELVKFVSSRLSTGILEIIAVPVLVALGLNATILGIEGMLAKIVVSIIVVILNYVLSKLLVFNK